MYKAKRKLSEFAPPAYKIRKIDKRMFASTVNTKSYKKIIINKTKRVVKGRINLFKKVNGTMRVISSSISSKNSGYNRRNK